MQFRDAEARVITKEKRSLASLISLDKRIQEGVAPANQIKERSVYDL